MRIFADRERLVTGSRDKKVRVWSLESGECLKTFEGHTNEIQGLKILKNGGFLLSSCWKEDEIRVWIMDSDRPVHKFAAHRNGTRCFVKNHAGRLISGGEDKTIRVWSYLDS